jgi:glycosyltransferase involved in cell wall biosynthesis
MMLSQPPQSPPTSHGHLPRQLAGDFGRPPQRIMMTVDAVGGVWRYAMDLGAALRARGIQLSFVGFGPRPAALQAEEARSIGKLIWVDAPLDWMAQSKTDLAHVPLILRRLVEDHQPDLLHLNLPSQAVGLDVDIPVVAVSHSCVTSWFRVVRGTETPSDWAWQTSLTRAGFDAVEAVVTPSQSHADLITACYGGIGNLTVIHNAIASDLTSTDRSEAVVAAGRWWDDSKNGRVLDEAAANVAWPVRMAGATVGPSGQRFETRHAEALGEVSSREARRLTASAGIFVSPSLYEPFGLAPLEAASAATPLVLADIPTYRELWDGAALFAQADAPDAFAEAINSLIADSDRRNKLSQAAKARARRFNPATQSQAYLDLYQRLLAQQPLLTATA